MARRPARDWPLDVRLELLHMLENYKSLIDRIVALKKTIWGFGASFKLAIGRQENFSLRMVDKAVHVVLGDQVLGKAVHELRGVAV